MTENIILRTKPSATPIIVEPILLSLVSIISFGTVAYVTKEIPLIATMFVILAISTTALLIVKAIAQLISREYADIVLTENFVRAKQGILDRDAWTVNNSSIQICKTEYPAFGLILDYGNLSIRTPAGHLKIRNIPHPNHWKDEIQKRIPTS